MSLHDLAEERSIAYHRAVAARIERDPSLLEGVRARLDATIAAGGRSLPYAQAWRRLLERPLPELLAFLVDGGEEARALRQSTPFAGLLEPAERWRIWREVRARFERLERLPLSDERRAAIAATIRGLQVS
ncbi:hypothetical protein [Vulgatibacter sp.]|uniref:hypothetical protein n=1 Tax=Vulgatibacter sp. TaxID=1971226 RepID=UPI0035659BFB